MSAGQYQENRRMMRNMYDKLSQETAYGCQGSCTCSMGTRTPYDMQQYERATSGQVFSYPIGPVPGWPI